MEEPNKITQTDLFGNEVIEWHEKRKENVNKKHESIRAEYKKLYNEKRIRHDDVIKELANKFYMSPITIERILRK